MPLIFDQRATFGTRAVGSPPPPYIVYFIIFLYLSAIQPVLIQFSEPRARKRTVSSASSASSASSSTSTELCDDPDGCCSERSVDDDDGDGGGNDDGTREDGTRDDDTRVGGTREDGGTGFGGTRDGGEPGLTLVDDGDVTLAEVLRANSEMLNRMCRGSAAAAAGASAETTAGTDLEERLPDLINDIESLQQQTAAAAAADYDDDDDGPADDEAPARPFAPFPAKVRQPKRLGVELGLYPDGTN